jgi:hypothetical protein
MEGSARLVRRLGLAGAAEDLPSDAKTILAEPVLCACDYLRVVTLYSGTGLGKSIRRRLLHETIENNSSADGYH